jgi:hypothetical protein
VEAEKCAQSGESEGDKDQDEGNIEVSILG